VRALPPYASSVARCSICGHDNRESARFCDSCGAPLAGVPEPGREERKVVTVLFADLVGFTSRAETLDPEDVRALLSPYYARLRAELERLGGTVEKFIGDAVMAVFGAPVAHEDDPERAVRAALAIRDWVREEDDLQVRIAVNTGEALVLLGARPAQGEGMVAGDVVNTAARLQSAAPVNGVLVGETTYRATRHTIDYGEAEPVAAKGKAEPVPVWEALQARSRFGVDLAAPAPGPLVGRAHELDQLSDAVARAKREVMPQLVTLVGVPGIGKSRLIGELAERLRLSEELIYWRQGRSLPYGEGVSFWALAEMVKAQAGILESDSEQQAGARLAETVADLLPGDPEAPWVEERLRVLVGLGAGTETTADRRDDSFAAWRRFFEAMADRRPLVLVFEDLQWADEGLLDFIDHLVDWAAGVPLLVLCTTRPELLERRAGWGGGKPSALTLSLSPLTDEDTARLVHGLLEQTLLPAETQAALLARAGGNPLYAEQYAHLLKERGTLDELPETVQGIIAARLDALSTDEKSLLQDAAVLGKVFWAGAAAVVGGHELLRAQELLHTLERKEFLARARRSSVGSELEYSFRHALVRDVAYGQIPRAARAQRHQAAAAWITSLGRPEDHAEMLAHHAVSALEFATAAGQPIEQLAAIAARALGPAGDRAARLQSLPAALGYYRRALELTPDSDPGRGRLLLRAGRAAGEADTSDARELLEEALQVALEQGDLAAAAEAEAALGFLKWMTGDSDALERFEHAVSLVAREPDSRGKSYAYAQLGRTLTLRDKPDEAQPFLQEALAVAERLDLADLRLYALHYLGLARVNSGDRSGLADLESSAELARIHDPTFAPRALNNFASMLFMLGEVRQARELSADALGLAERLGLKSQVRWQHMMTVANNFDSCDWEASLAGLADDPSLLEEGYYHASVARFIRAFITFARGGSPLEEIERALAEAKRLEDPQSYLPLLAGAAFVFSELGRTREAEELLRRYAGTVRTVGMAHLGFSPLAALAAFDLGMRDELADAIASTHASRWRDANLAILAGRFAEGADELERMGVAGLAPFVRLAAGDALLSEGRRAEADEQLVRAGESFRRVGATRYLQRTEALLAATA
jgi:class 3 adenylate cyclase/tetratricopeptide (TPR) repeat protein